MSTFQIPVGDITAITINFDAAGCRNRCGTCGEVISSGFASILIYAKRSKLPYYLGEAIRCTQCDTHMPSVKIFTGMFGAIREVLRLRNLGGSAPETIVWGTNDPFLHMLGFVVNGDTADRQSPQH